MSDTQVEIGFEKRDISTRVPYVFVAVLVLGVTISFGIVHVVFYYLTDFESRSKELTDEVLRFRRVAYHEQVWAELRAKYTKAIPDNPEEAESQAQIAMDRIKVNDFVRPAFAKNAPLEGADILSPLHSGGQHNPFTIGQENLKAGNERLRKAGIDQTMKTLVSSGVLKSRTGTTQVSDPVWTNGGR